MVPSTSQVTVVGEAPLTVAVKVCVWPVVSPTRLGLMVTLTLPVDCPAMVMVVTAILEESATDAAVSVIAGDDGTLAGAV